MTISPKGISDTIRVRREAQGLSRERLAQLAEVSTSTIVRLENEAKIPNGLTLLVIAKALRIDLTKIQDELVS